jgi:hypothetical protein
MKPSKAKTVKAKSSRAAAAEALRKGKAEARERKAREKAEAEANAEAAANVNEFVAEAEAINEQYDKWNTIKNKAENLQITADKEKAALANKISDAKAKVGDGKFKAWVNKFTRVSYSTAKRILLIADGRGEEGQVRLRRTCPARLTGRVGETQESDHA